MLCRGFSVSAGSALDQDDHTCHGVGSIGGRTVSASGSRTRWPSCSASLNDARWRCGSRRNTNAAPGKRRWTVPEPGHPGPPCRGAGFCRSHRHRPDSMTADQPATRRVARPCRRACRRSRCPIPSPRPRPGPASSRPGASSATRATRRRTGSGHHRPGHRLTACGRAWPMPGVGHP